MHLRTVFISLFSVIVITGCNVSGPESGSFSQGATYAPQAVASGSEPLDLAVQTGRSNEAQDKGATAADEPVREALASTQYAGAALTSQAGGIAGTMLGSSDYRINPFDVIEISVFQVPELSRSVQVNTVGQFSLPLVGAIDASGKTPGELEREITQRLGERYLQSPDVNVFVKEYQSQRVTIDGAVNSPGVYQLTGNSGLIQVIALARGLDRVADPGGVLVFRTIDGKRHAAAFDIRPIRRGEQPDPRIMGGDVIVVDTSASRTAWRGLRESLGVMGFFRPFVL